MPYSRLYLILEDGNESVLGINAKRARYYTTSHVPHIRDAVKNVRTLVVRPQNPRNSIYIHRIPAEDTASIATNEPVYKTKRAQSVLQKQYRLGPLASVTRGSYRYVTMMSPSMALDAGMVETMKSQPVSVHEARIFCAIPVTPTTWNT